MMNPVSHSGGSRPRRAGSDPGHILPAQRVREPILTRIQENDGGGAGMPRVVLAPASVRTPVRRPPSVRAVC